MQIKYVPRTNRIDSKKHKIKYFSRNHAFPAFIDCIFLPTSHNKATSPPDNKLQIYYIGQHACVPNKNGWKNIRFD